LFKPDQSIIFDVEFKTPIAGIATGVATLTDYFGKPVLTREIAFMAEKNNRQVLPVELGVLPRGYYELNVDVQILGDDGKAEASAQASMGVADHFNRTAEAVREQDYRIGLKIWYLSDA
jgi:hypothetical protein